MHRFVTTHTESGKQYSANLAIWQERQTLPLPLSALLLVADLRLAYMRKSRISAVKNLASLGVD
jgi:hypothetical protein